MPSKNNSLTSRGPSSKKFPFIQGPWKRQTPPQSQHLGYTKVRKHSNIPDSVWEFFQRDPKTGREYSEEERRFYCQVYLHEVDEGVRHLKRAGKDKEASIVGNFDNQLHPVSRLDFLRKTVDDSATPKLPPQRVVNQYKARNNQWGSFKAFLGSHPALAATSCGFGYKEANEDAYLILPEKKVMGLADGMGGHVAGHLASCIAIDFFEYGVTHGMEIAHSIGLANAAILARSQSDKRLGGIFPMGCTFAAVQLKHNLLQVAHVGDSKVLVVREGKITFETQDHTQGQQLLREGLIDVATAFELNHVLNRCLGLDSMHSQRDVSKTELMLQAGDRVLIVTDGISDNLFVDTFDLCELAKAAATGSISQAANQILHTCENAMLCKFSPSGRLVKHDNLSLALLEFRG